MIRLLNGSIIQRHRSVYGQVMENLYRSSRAVIFPSICPEPAPYVVYEALLRGRLVVSSNIGGVPEQVANLPDVYSFPQARMTNLHNVRKYS